MAADWAGRWFELLEARGEDLRIRFGRAPGPGVEPTWTSYPHQRFDGVGAFGDLLEREGYRVAELPRGRDTAPPSRAGQILAFTRHLWIGRRHARSWKPAETPRTGEARVAWASLEREETARLLSSLRRSGVGMTAALLSGLHRSAQRELLVDATRTTWMIPANLRGAVSYPDRHANHSSFLQIDVRDGESPADVNTRLRGMLDRRAQWGPWPVLTIGERRGDAIVRRFDAAWARRPYFRTGTLSNLGAWPPEGTHAKAPDATRYFFCPPAIRSQPASAGALTWNGVLSLCLQIHPEAAPAAVAAEWLTRWVAIVREMAEKESP